MKKVLVLFAHPRFEQSRAQKVFVDVILKHQNITFCDLYELYPDFNINIPKEKELLQKHDIIIWQHPLYWYSSPPLLKQWIDMVLEFGWAYGPNGIAVRGKCVFNLTSSGGMQEAYSATGRNKYSIREFLRPFEQTANLCGMRYLPPFVIHGTHKLSNESLDALAHHFTRILSKLQNDAPFSEDFSTLDYLNNISL